MPKHDYVKILEDLKAEIAEPPRDLITFAYGCQEFCTTWHRGDYKLTFDFAYDVPLEDDIYPEKTRVNCIVIVEVKSYSVYHNDTATERHLSVTRKNRLFGELNTLHLPWRPEDATKLVK